MLRCTGLSLPFGYAKVHLVPLPARPHTNVTFILGSFYNFYFQLCDFLAARKSRFLISRCK